MPHISVTVGLLLALASLGVLIYFIHHAAASIQAENVIAAVGRELHQAIDRLYPECLGAGPRRRRRKSAEQDLPAGLRPRSAPGRGRPQRLPPGDRRRPAAGRWPASTTSSSGVAARPGKFVIEGGDLRGSGPATGSTTSSPTRSAGPSTSARAYPDAGRRVRHRPTRRGRGAGPLARGQRPVHGDQLRRPAGAALCMLAGKEIPSPCRYDDEGRLRVVADASTVPGIVNAAFHQIRQAARDDAAVTLRLLETIAAVAAQARGETGTPRCGVRPR